MRKVILFSLSLSVISGNLLAVDRTWNGTVVPFANKWQESTNWTTPSVPTATDNAILPAAPLTNPPIIPAGVQNTLTIDGTSANVPSVNGIQVNATGYTIVNDRGSFDIGNGGITGSALTFNNNATRTLTFISNVASTSGNTTINNSGTLVYSFLSNAPTTSIVTFPGSILRVDSTNPLDIGSLTGTGLVSVFTSNKTINVGLNNMPQTFAGSFQDNGAAVNFAVTKKGTGTFISTNTMHSYTGPTNVVGGTLEWNGNHAAGTSDFTVQSEATLSGTGTIQGDLTILQGGCVSPGNALFPQGKLTVVGVNVASDGILKINAAAGGNSCLTVGDAFVLTDTTLQVNPTSPIGSYNGAASNIIQSTGTAFTPDPTFVNNITGVPMMLSADVQFVGQNVTLALSQKSTEAPLRNAPINVGRITRALDQLIRDNCSGQAPSADQRTCTELNHFVSRITSEEQLIAAAEQMTSIAHLNIPDPLKRELSIIFAKAKAFAARYGYTNAVGNTAIPTNRITGGGRRNTIGLIPPRFQKTSFTTSALQLKNSLNAYGHDQARSHVRDNPGAGYIWVRGFGGRSDADKTEEEFGFRAETGGIMLGTDYQVNDSLGLGAAAGYSENKVDTERKLAKTRVKTPFGSLWGHYSFGSTLLAAGVTYGRDSFDSKRFITFLATPLTAQGAHKGYNVAPYLEVAHRFEVTECTQLTPFLGLDYFYSHQNAFLETGADILSLNVRAKSSSSIQPRLGLTVDHRRDWCDGGNTTYMLKLDYKARKPVKKRRVVSNFAGGTIPFTTVGRNETTHHFGVNSGINFTWENGTKLSVSYGGDFEKKQRSHMGYISIGKSL